MGLLGTAFLVLSFAAIPRHLQELEHHLARVLSGLDYVPSSLGSFGLFHLLYR